MKEELKSQLIAELNKAIKPEQDNEVEDDGRVQYHQATHTLQINEEAHIAAEKEGTEVEERIEKPEDEYADNCFNRNRDSSVHTVIVSVGKP